MRMKKVLSILLCLALIMGCLPSNVFAVETGLSSIHVMENEQYTVEEDRTVSTVHISRGATLTIPAGITLTVAEFLHNEGAVQNNGTLIIQPDDDSIGNDGTIQNNGVLTIQADLCNFGTVTNTGTLEVAGALHLNNDETLVNDGTMTVTGDVFHTAAITGSGKLTVNGTVHGALHDYGAIEKCMACGWQVDVAVNMPEGFPLAFTMRNTATIGEVKAELNSRFSQYAAENMRLIYDGQVTEDSKSLAYYGADTSITLTMVYEERYNLWIGGAEVTSAKTSGEGWSYDPTTNTLTLNGASITSGSYADASIYATDALNIVLHGSNTVSGSYFGIYADSSVNISGDGSLNAVGHWDGIQAHGNVTVNSGSITFKGESSYGIKAEGNTLTFNGGYVSANGGASGNGIVANTVVLGSSSHLKVTHSSAAVAGTLSATGGLCRTSADGTFTETIAASGAYFEYMGSDHVTYTKKDAQNHTVACVHGLSFDTAHKYENGSCTACSNLNGSLDVSRLSTDLIITATGYSMNGKSYLYEGNYTLTGTTSHGVIFEAGEYQLTANNLKIVKGDSYTGSAIELKNGATLHLVLVGDNTLTGGWEGSGIRVNEGTSLTISGDGILRAGYQQGGNAAYGAAIGGYCNSNFGTITINGGTIYATGGGGASIGSGSLYGSSNTMAGTIVLNGGTIYADLIGNARSSGAVLKGSGAKVYCNSIQADTTGLNEIVYSKDGTSATYYCNDFIVTGDVANCSWDQTNKVLNINGGTVTVSNADKNAATSQRIYIQGTANVTLNGVNISSTTGAPIEIRDYNDTNVTLTLSGSNTLISQTGGKAALHKSRGQQATNSDAATLTINGSGSLTAVGGNNAAGIGGGSNNGDVHNIIINAGTISATGTGRAAGIGSSDGGSTWNIKINGGNITASGSPGIGANTDHWQGVKDAAITGGMVTTNSYKGSSPTGGLVSADGGKAYIAHSDYILNQNLTIATDGKLTVAEGAELTVADGVTLTNEGVLVNDGTISGNLANEGAIYNKGTLPANVGGNVYEQYVKVNNGRGTGTYTEGSTVTITADAPASGKMFAGWTIELGTVTLTDSAKAETTFTMPEGCVIVKANYADVVATVTDSDGNVQYYSDEHFAQNEWSIEGGTLTLYTDIRPFRLRIPANGVLDLNGHTMQTDMLNIDQSCTIQNGTISMWDRGTVEEDAVVTFKNVTITKDEFISWEVEITNNGTIIDAGLTLNGVTISGESIKTGLTEDRITLTGIPTEGYVYDGTAHEPGVKCGETALVKGTDYTVTFSHSNGSNNPVNAGTVTMTITGTGNYTGTVTKTYIIDKAALTVTAENKTATYGDAAPQYTAIGSGFKNGETFADLDGTLSFACEYAQFSDKGTYTITPSGYESGNYEISYVSGTLTVNPKAITVTIANKTSVYGKAITELTATDSGIVNNDSNVYSLATTATSTANVGKYEISGTAIDGNYTIIFVSGEYEITKCEITITVEAKNTIVNTALPTYTYKVEGLLGEDKLVTEPTLISNADITVVGEYDITASGADAGSNYSIKYVPAKLTVLTDNAVDAATSYTGELKDYDPKTVTSADKDELQDMLDEINTILDNENITTNGKNAMEEVKKRVENLIKAIDDVAKATDTENTDKVEDVTAGNVTPDDKSDLEKAKADLEKALKDNGGNYTEDEKKAIEDELKRIDDALKVIKNVEAVEDATSNLPETVEPDDEENVAKIEAAKKVYEALSNYEKSLVSKQTKENLDKLTAAAVAYDIIKGDGSEWKKDSNETLSFTANGAVSRFLGIEINGKAVDPKHYEVKAGSTIVTLKQDYLDTLEAGKYTITFLYTNGETAGFFVVEAAEEETVPPTTDETVPPATEETEPGTVPKTGDDANVMLWFSLMIVSCAAILVLLNYKRFVSYGGKYSK